MKSQLLSSYSISKISSVVLATNKSISIWWNMLSPCSQGALPRIPQRLGQQGARKATSWSIPKYDDCFTSPHDVLMCIYEYMCVYIVVVTWICIFVLGLFSSPVSFLRCHMLRYTPCSVDAEVCTPVSQLSAVTLQAQWFIVWSSQRMPCWNMSGEIITASLRPHWESWFFMGKSSPNGLNSD